MAHLETVPRRGPALSPDQGLIPKVSLGSATISQILAGQFIPADLRATEWVPEPFPHINMDVDLRTNGLPCPLHMHPLLLIAAS